MNLIQRWSKNRPKRFGLFAGASLCAGLALLIGCGGGGGGAGGGGGGMQKLSEDNAAIDVAVAGQQSVAMGQAVPFAVLQATAPAGVFSAARPNGVIDRFHPNTLTLVPGLNLYASTVITGKTLTTSFFLNGDGTGSAGSITATANQTINSNYTFPVLIDTTINITAGNIPMTGGFQIKFFDAGGKNTIITHDITGTFDKSPITLVNNKFKVSMSISGADKTLAVALADHIHLTDGQFGIDCDLTGLTGSPATTIVGNLTVNPEKWTGNGTLDLVKGTFSLYVTDPLGNGIIGGLTNGTYQVVLPISGIKQTITDPNGYLTSVLGTGGTGTTSGGTGSTAGFAQPVAIQGSPSVTNVTVRQALADGEMVGFSDDAGRTDALYWSSPTSNPTFLPVKNAGDTSTALGMSTLGGGTIVGAEFDGTSNHPCFWKKTAGQFGTPTWLFLGSLGKQGEADAVSNKTLTVVGDITSSAGVKQPVLWDPNQTLFPLKTDGRSTDLSPIGIDDSNDIIGQGTYPNLSPVVWLKATVATGSQSGVLVTPSALPGIGLNSNLSAQAISPNGVVVGGSNQGAIYWTIDKSNNVIPAYLLLPSGAGPAGLAYGVSADGTKATGLMQASPTGSTSDMTLWSSLTKAPTDVSTALNSTTYSRLAGFFLLSSGSVVGLGLPTGSTTPTWLYFKAK